MEDKKMPDAVPYIALESAMARYERTVKRFIIGIIISIVLVVASNLAWLYAWTRYDYSSDTVTVDSKDGGNAYFIGTNGDIHNGESSSPQENKETQRREVETDKDN